MKSKVTRSGIVCVYLNKIKIIKVLLPTKRKHDAELFDAFGI